MGWFSSSKPAEEEGTTTRQNRKQCWDARDAYFSCLDRQRIVKAGEEGAACAAENKAYAENCAHSWIEYFNQRRVIADAQKERLARGAAQAEEWNAKNGKS
ncbi:cytochrome oxidase c subunit VIb-domain-containing protein [Coprinopsis sp. MPI-PUGE-AT-0042]|nr:cytochrome oxidase c subunit VIb-domain-containing protein [Coprinopsis sp. MPI-PUGE-AT-0042]